MDTITKAEVLQTELHEFINNLLRKNPKLTYAACHDTWILNKLAELENKIDLIAMIKF